MRKLSEREAQVLKGLADGDGLKEIAFKLGITLSVVSKAKLAMEQKLSARSATNAVFLAVKSGLI